MPPPEDVLTESKQKFVDTLTVTGTGNPMSTDSDKEPIYWDRGFMNTPQVRIEGTTIELRWESGAWVPVICMSPNADRIALKPQPVDDGDGGPRRMAVAVAREAVKAEQARLARVLAALERVVSDEKPEPRKPVIPPKKDARSRRRRAGR